MECSIKASCNIWHEYSICRQLGSISRKFQNSNGQISPYFFSPFLQSKYTLISLQFKMFHFIIKTFLKEQKYEGNSIICPSLICPAYLFIFVILTFCFKTHISEHGRRQDFRQGGGRGEMKSNKLRPRKTVLERKKKKINIFTIISSMCTKESTSLHSRNK